MRLGSNKNRLYSTIGISILTPPFYENGDCFNRFRWYNDANGTLLTDMQEINTLELPKLSSEDDGSKRWQWLKLLKLREVEEMEALAKGNQAIKNVISRVYEMSEDERERRIAEAREMAEHDIASRLESARMVGEARGEERSKQDTARNMKSDGEPIEKIARYTGLSEDIIAAL